MRNGKADPMPGGTRLRQRGARGLPGMRANRRAQGRRGRETGAVSKSAQAVEEDSGKGGREAKRGMPLTWLIGGGAAAALLIAAAIFLLRPSGAPVQQADANSDPDFQACLKPSDAQSRGVRARDRLGQVQRQRSIQPLQQPRHRASEEERARRGDLRFRRSHQAQWPQRFCLQQPRQRLSQPAQG